MQENRIDYMSLDYENFLNYIAKCNYKILPEIIKDVTCVQNSKIEMLKKELEVLKIENDNAKQKIAKLKALIDDIDDLHDDYMASKDEEIKTLKNLLNAQKTILK